MDIFNIAKTEAGLQVRIRDDVIAFDPTIYHPGDEGGIPYNDPEIAIKWPELKGADLNINDRDRNWPTFAEYRTQRGL